MKQRVAHCCLAVMILLAAFSIGVGCAQTAEPTPTAAPTNTAVPPTDTPTPEPTATATAVPTETPTSTPTPTPTPEPLDAETLLADAFALYGELETFKSSLTAIGTLETSGSCLVDKVLAQIYCQSEGAQDIGDVSAERVMVDSRMWVRSEIIGPEWVQVSDTKEGYDGFVEAEYLEQIVQVTETDLNGRPVFQVEVIGDVEAILRRFLTSEVRAVQAILEADVAEATGSVWIDQETNHILRTVVDIHVDDFEVTVVNTYSQFDEPVDIPQPLGEALLQLVEAYVTAVRDEDLEAVQETVSTPFQQTLTTESLHDLAQARELWIYPDFERAILITLDSTQLEAEVPTLQLRGLLEYEGLSDLKGLFMATAVVEDDSWKLDEIQIYPDLLETPDHEQILMIIDSFMVAIEVQDIETAYASFGTLARTEVVADDIAELRENVPVLFENYESIDLSTLNFTNSLTLPADLVWGEYAFAEGVVTYEDGHEEPLFAILEHETDGWWLIHINIGSQ